MSLFVCRSCFFLLKKLVKKRLTIDIIFMPRMEIVVLNVGTHIRPFKKLLLSAVDESGISGRQPTVNERKTKANCLLNWR